VLQQKHMLLVSEGWYTIDILIPQSCKSHDNIKRCFRGSLIQTRTPETFDIVSKTVDVAARNNLAQISKILAQITSGSEFNDDNPIYVPINDYVRKAIQEMSEWLIEGSYKGFT
jgi:hypothetical protein